MRSPSFRVVVVGLIAALASALLIVTWRARGGESGAAIARVPAFPAGTEHEGAELAPLDTVAQRESVELSETAPGLHPSSLHPVTLRGSLTVDGGSRGDGSFELCVWDSSNSVQRPVGLASSLTVRERVRGRHTRRVLVHSGRWEVSVPRHSARSFTRGILGGLPLADLRVEEAEGVEVRDVDVRLSARVLHPARLTVVDASTGRPLESIRVVVLPVDDQRTHPGDLAPTFEARGAPVECPPSRSTRAAYLVGGDGYAWKRVEWNHLEAVERAVALERSGALDVRIVFDGKLDPWDLTLSDGAGSPCVRLAASESLRIEGLTPGDYRLALAPHASFVESQVGRLAITATHVIAAATTEVELRDTIGEQPSVVGLAGRVHMPPGWSRGGPHLVVRALGATAVRHLATGGILGGLEVTRSGDSWSFSSPRAVPDGTYLLVEQRTWTTSQIRVGPRGTHDAELRVPEPVLLEVQVVDPASGEPLSGSRLEWRPPTLPTGQRPRASGGDWIEEQAFGLFLARVPHLDTIEFEARAPDRTTVAASLRPRGGPTPLRIALAP